METSSVEKGILFNLIKNSFSNCLNDEDSTIEYLEALQSKIDPEVDKVLIKQIEDFKAKDVNKALEKLLISDIENNSIITLAYFDIIKKLNEETNDVEIRNRLRGKVELIENMVFTGMIISKEKEKFSKIINKLIELKNSIR
jgi:hypothetical protein